MRVVLDLQGAQTMSRFRGIGRYTLSFTRALIRERGEHEVVIVLNGMFPNTLEGVVAQFSDLLPPENIRVWYAPGPLSNIEAGNEWRQDVAALLREAFIAGLGPDVVYVSSFLEGFSDGAIVSAGEFDRDTPVVASLYDLIPLTNPKVYLDPYPTFQTFYFNRIKQMKRTHSLLAISEYCALEGEKNLTGYDGQIISISSAIEEDFKPMADYPGREQEFEERLKISGPYILYTGGADDRKNLPALIKAFSRLPGPLRKQHQLVFAGRLHEQEQRKVLRSARSAGLKPGELVLTGYISDDDLKMLYSHCTVYVFPSWHEGFGLPALEAMACGAPVIGARASSLPEVIGLEQAMFDPFDDEDILAVLSRSLQDDDYRDMLKAHGRDQVKKFSWAKTARLAWDVIESVTPGGSGSQSPETLLTRLLESIGQVLKGGSRSDLELARIADCIERNRLEAESPLG